MLKGGSARRNRRGWWLVLLLGAMAVRMATITAQGMWRDEVDALRFATAPWPELMATFTRPGWNGPLYFLLLRFWVEGAGSSAFALRTFSTLWAILSLPFLYHLGRRLIGHAAPMAVILFAASPYLVWYAQEVKMYTLVPFLVLVALYALERAARGEGRWWWGVLVATSFAFYAHILAALLIPVEVLWFLLMPGRSRRAWRGGLLTLAGLTLPYLPLLRWQLPLLFQERITGYPDLPLRVMAETLVNGWSAGILVRYGPLAASLFLSLLALGTLWLLRIRPRHLLRLWVWMVLPLLGIWFVSLRGPIFTDRYLIWSAPAFYLLAAAGLEWLRRSWSPLATLALLLILLLDGVNLVAQARTPVKPRFRDAAAYVAEHRAPNEPLLFQIPYNHFVFDYYYGPPLAPWLEAPYTNWRTEDGGYLIGEAQLDGQMRELLHGVRSLWLIYSEADLYDERELVRHWLDAHARLDRLQQFHGVTVYHYTFESPP